MPESMLALDDEVERFLRAVCRGDEAEAARLLAHNPGLADHSIHAACAAADDTAVAHWLERDPSSVSAQHAGTGWSPLLFACASRMHIASPERAAASVRCAQLLLDRGADPNSFTLADDDARSHLPALYRACVSNNVPVVRLLLERGAEVNDGESIYHSAEMHHRECLELLLTHGAEISARHAIWDNTPLYFLTAHAGQPAGADAPWLHGMRWLLEHGADPNVTSGAEQATPLHRAAGGQSPAAVELLLAHGANPNLPRADGKSAWVVAFRGGQAAILEQLETAGAQQGGLSPADELIGACMRADDQAAGAVVQRHPDLVASLAPEDRHLLAHAAGNGQTASVRLMAALGFDLTAEGPWGGTPLHWAAWFGRTQVVPVLLAAGAPVNVRDSTYGSSPIAWACHGSTNCRTADDDYCAIVDLLIDAGSDYALSINKWNEPAESMASAPVKARLEERGFVRREAAPPA